VKPNESGESRLKPENIQPLTLMKNQTDSLSPDILLHDLRMLVAEAESMIADPANEPSAAAVATLRTRFAAAQARLAEAYAGAKRKVAAGARFTDEAIRASPYQSLAIAADLGLLAGVLLGRRSR